MRLGFVLPHIGSWAGPDALVQVASRAEELGFDSLWTTERLLVPLQPRVPYPIGDGRIPDVYRTTLDPLDSLTFVAGQTSRIRLGVSVLNLPWYNLPLLARRLTTIDVLSEGRLSVGLGLGWSPEAYEAAGRTWNVRGRRFTEAVQALKTIWTTDPVEFHGEFFDISRSVIGPKPVQKPHPPIYMAAFAPSALERVARESNGWNPVAIPPAGVAQMFEGIKETARQVGRDPSELELVVRANVELTETPLGDDRGPFSGTADQIEADIASMREIGATQLFFDPTVDPTVRSLDDYVGRMELYADIASEADLPVVRRS